MKTAYINVYKATIYTEFTFHNSRFIIEVNSLTTKIEVVIKANNEIITKYGISWVVF